MNENAPTAKMHAEMAQLHAAAGFLRAIVIGITAFLTVVDLFAAQAILPSLVTHFGVTPAAMGLAVNACTLGMAVAGFGVALLSRRIDRRAGILFSLSLLAIPTTLLAFAPNIWVFAGLRVLQGLAMSTAFCLTLAYMGERFSAAEAAGAFAAYITGNVASNLIGRFIAAAVVDHAGLAANFYLFAALNLLGAILVYFTVERVPPMTGNGTADMAPMAAWTAHLKNPVLAAGFGIGFCILFAFIGTFTYINFVLTRPPLSVGMMELGVIYLVFLPAIVTTPLAGLAARRARHAARSLGGARSCGAWLAAHAPSPFAERSRRNGARRCRHVLRAGAGHGLRQPRGVEQSRRGQRNLPRVLLSRRACGQRGPRPALRPLRMGGLCGRHRRGAWGCGPADGEACPGAGT